MKCLIVDDEQLARKLLESYVEKIPYLELVDSVKSPLKALDVLQEQQVDLMFLDIQMPDLLGTDLLKMLPQKPLVILTTAYQEYAVEGYQLDVIDYLLKPISLERFLEGVKKAHRQWGMAESSKEQARAFITLKADHKIHKVLLDDLNYIEGMKEYVAYYTDEKRIMVLESLKKLEERLPENFIRIHKSYIVNMDKVTSLYGNQVEIGGKYYPVSKTKIEEVKRQFET